MGEYVIPPESERTVEIAGRQFVIEPPDTERVLAILQRIGRLAMRAEQEAALVLGKNPSSRAVLIGLLSALDVEELEHLGIIVLPFDDGEKGRKWLEKNGVTVAPIFKALFLNIELSRDLMEALQVFFDGVERVLATANVLLARFAPKEQAEQDESGDSGS